MAKRIYKYPLTVGINELEIPVGSLILNVIEQGGVATAYVMVNDTKQTEKRTLRVFGTGWDLPAVKLEYITTVKDSMFVWHVFEELP